MLFRSAPDWYNETGKGFSVQRDIDLQIVATVQEVIEVAKELGVSQVQVSRLESKILAKIKENFDTN